MNTGDAAKRLDTYRSTGAGPLFYRFGGCVRYRVKELKACHASPSVRGRKAPWQASP